MLVSECVASPSTFPRAPPLPLTLIFRHVVHVPHFHSWSSPGRLRQGAERVVLGRPHTKECSGAFARNEFQLGGRRPRVSTASVCLLLFFAAVAVALAFRHDLLSVGQLEVGSKLLARCTFVPACWLPVVAALCRSLYVLHCCLLCLSTAAGTGCPLP